MKLKEDFSDRLHTICAFVNHEGPNTLVELLLGTDMSKDFDLLSIDIDSFDWHVWYSLINYQPKVVIIEINSSIPPGIFQTHRDRDIMGSSFTATLELGKSKGYTLVCHTGNMFFVRDDYVAAIGLSKVERDFPEVLFDYTWCLTNEIMPHYRPEAPKKFSKKLKSRVKSLFNRLNP
ncbi:MAG TPA: hypothetical protein ENN23_08770 [Deltaproteobacteria bacterium]|nr:hypothetical protein [Deltaproteobacteria bacterium]